MAIQAINPSALVQPNGYAQVTVSSGTKHVHTAGQVAFDVDGNLVGAGPDYRAQAFQATRNLYAALAAAGAAPADVVSITIYVVDPTGDNLDQFRAGFREARMAAGGTETALALVGVSVLGVPGAVVELTASALID